MDPWVPIRIVVVKHNKSCYRAESARTIFHAHFAVKDFCVFRLCSEATGAGIPGLMPNFFYLPLMIGAMKTFHMAKISCFSEAHLTARECRVDDVCEY
jgi:hypothetical protein